MVMRQGKHPEIDGHRCGTIRGAIMKALAADRLAHGPVASANDFRDPFAAFRKVSSAALRACR